MDSHLVLWFVGSESRTGVNTGFQGCIRELMVEDEDLREKPLDLSYAERALTRKFVKVKTCGCKDTGCQNNGVCVDRKYDFRCECRVGFTGPQCQVEGKKESITAN